MPELRYSVLGPVRAWADGLELPLGPPKRRALLTTLLARPGEHVSMREAVEVLWGQCPPQTAANVVHQHAGALRRLFEPELTDKAAAQHLISTSGGYRLTLQEESLDLLRFRRLRRCAHRAMEAGEHEHGGRLLVEALGLWRAPVASGDLPIATDHPLFVFVNNEYAAAAREAAEAAPAYSSRLLAALVPVLLRAAEHHPLDEALQAGTISVLAASGRQVEAVERFSTVRRVLAEELGIEPSPELRDAHEKVLRQDAAVSAADSRPERSVSGAGDGAPPGGACVGGASASGSRMEAGIGPRPAQLPSDTVSFAGRDRELRDAQALLDEALDPNTPTPVGVISGMAGCGKTTLAVHWAHRTAARFPDGQLYVNLRGYHPALPPLTPSEVMREVIEALGAAPDRVPDGPGALASMYRSLFARRRLLVVLDNARDTEQVRPLLPGATGSLVLITSRHRLDGLIVTGNARFVPLGLLPREEGVELLTRRLGSARVAAEKTATERIVDLCGRLPLTLAIAASRAVLHPTFSLADIAAELEESRGGLDAFATRDAYTDTRSVFSWSYQALSAPAARLFRLLGLHPAPDISAYAAASLLGIPVGEVRPALTELMENHLLTEHVPGRFSSHELLRVYAGELCRCVDAEEDRARAALRALQHHVHGVERAAALLTPQRDAHPSPEPPPDVSVQRIPGAAAATAWLQEERQGLLVMAETAADGGPAEAELCRRLAAGLEHHLDRHGRWREQLALQACALRAAQRVGDLRGEADALRAMGFADCRLGAFDEARRRLTRALRLMTDLTDATGEGRTLRHLAFLANMLNDHRLALEHYGKALNCYARADDVAGRASVLNEMGWTYILLGDHRLALVHCEKATVLHQRAGSPGGEAAAWDSIGIARQHLGDLDGAQAAYQRAVQLYRVLGDRTLEADTLVHMGDCHQEAGEQHLSVSRWQDAYAIYESMEHPETETVRLRLDRPPAVPHNTTAHSRQQPSFGPGSSGTAPLGCG